MANKFQTVKGMQDFLPEKARKKQWIEDVCRKVFERYGFQPLETPAVEDFALLSAKGSAGEEIKDEIYYFKDKGDRELGLRFDLTVPLARVVASNPQLPKPFKRYAIERVYRYDRPQAKRWREFTQADYDIIGTSSLLADFEIIAVTIDVMKELGFKKGEFYVRINDRRLLEEIALEVGIKKNKIVDCFRIIDKLDKIGEEGVKKELEAVGINTQILGQLKANKLKGLKLKNTAPLEELQGLMGLLKKNNLDEFVKVDLSLARGLEYYTGIVIEVVTSGPSVGGGGRYDKLIGIYGGQETAAVGSSFGIERLLEALENKLKISNPTKVFVIGVGNVQNKVIEVVRKIRGLEVAADFDLIGRNISKNLDYAGRQGIPFVVIVGEDELKKKEITFRDMKTGKQKKVRIARLESLKKVVLDEGKDQG